jgi:hypothetical protein
MLPQLARADFQNLASPGPLSQPHAALDASCDKCHVPFKGIPSSACLACHTGTRARIESGTGTHAQWEKQGRKCSSCHTDHKGRGHALTPAPEKNFDHAITGFLLVGKHQSVACASCHTKGANGPRWVGLAKDCAGCHADVHKGALGNRCSTCHAVAGWKPTTRTIADHQVPMNGQHAGLTCALCHKLGAHLASTWSCGDCHKQNHGGTKAPCATCHNTTDWKSATFQHDFCTCILPGKHQTAQCLACHPKFVFTPTPFACAACHTKDRKHEDLGACARCHSALSWKTKTFDHNQARVGFKIEGKHLEVGCENCHKQKGVFRGVPKTCEGCHAVPKHGNFGACAQCHTVAGWKPQNFSHDKTRFPLDGKHAPVRCETCHAKFKKGELKPGPNECVLCHADPHGGQFRAPHTSLPINDSRSVIGKINDSRSVMLASNGPVPHVTSPAFGCMDCHTTTGWKPSTVDVAMHGKFSYPLRGRHEDVACARCHDAGVFIGTPRTCNACHLDRHRGRVGATCERCHDESGWKHHPGFEHFAATGFALEGAHDGLACAQCHGKNHDRLATITRVTCATCHTPRHGDLFGTECASCHKPTKFSDVPKFDHAQTMFPLDRRHLAVRCTTCHDASRGARISPECRSCHDDPHRGRALLECDECHRADRWNLVRFDHDRAEWPLRGAHFTTPCRQCHTDGQFTGVRTECIACHRGDKQKGDASTNMAARGHASFGFDCAPCHNAMKW